MALRVQDVINTVIRGVNTEVLEKTVDTLKIGDARNNVTGIVTTFTASIDVIKEAIKLGANMIITHEPTFYDHKDVISWQNGCNVYETKHRLIKNSNLAIWRLHDYWHMIKPDGIMTGIASQLGWESYADNNDNWIYSIPPLKLSVLETILKERLNASAVRTIGNVEMMCSRVGFLPGAAYIEKQIEFLKSDTFDVLICGETIEWMICEYVRDAVQVGENKSLIILGHANSEEAGMKYLAEWLKLLITEIPIHFVPAGDPFNG